jgi:hypothetical protein
VEIAKLEDNFSASPTLVVGPTVVDKELEASVHDPIPIPLPVIFHKPVSFFIWTHWA